MKKIYNNIYHVGDSGCSVYLIDTQSEDGLVLIDCGMSLDMIKKINLGGLDPNSIRHCIITHFHIDHIGACYNLKNFNQKIKFYAHELDANAIEEEGHDEETAALWYGVKYKPIKLDKKFKKDIETLKFGPYDFQCIHTPGHTPGSISVFIQVDNKTKILFGQDIHGPFMESFHSNLNDYQKSMQKLLDLDADILCEGHFGIIQPANKVRKYITDYMNTNRP